jgi:hypothetical protein
MLCRSREPFDYAIYGTVYRALSDGSLEHRTGWKIPRIEANCWGIATHRTSPGLCDFTIISDLNAGERGGAEIVSR